MAAGQVLSGLDPYRVLQVAPEARIEVIEAAFVVLRELVLREDPPDAPRRLAQLNAAHRALASPGGVSPEAHAPRASHGRLSPGLAALCSARRAAHDSGRSG